MLKRHRFQVLVLFGLLYFASVCSAEFLYFIEQYTEHENGISGLGGEMLAISPDGGHLYGFDFAFGAVAAFEVDEESGRLTFLEAHHNGENGVEGLWGAKYLEISPDGKFVYVAGYYDESLAVFSRNPSTGQLSFKYAFRPANEVPDGVSFVRNVRVSPNGERLFLVGKDSNAASNVLAAYSRSVETGGITFDEYFYYNINTEEGIQSLALANSMTLSCDGSTLYVPGGAYITVFGIHPDSGDLGIIQTITDQENGVEGLYPVHNVYLGPECEFLYSVGKNRDSGSTVLGLYQRNNIDGSLTFLGLTGEPGHEAYAPTSPKVIQFAPSGTKAIAANSQFDLLIGYQRNAITGELTIDTVVDCGVTGLDGVGEPRFATFLPTGEYIYTTASYESSIFQFGLVDDDVIKSVGFEDCPTP